MFLPVPRAPTHQHTQFCSERLPDDFPLWLVGWVVLLYGFHHQVHYVEQHPEVRAVGERDGWLPDGAAAGGAVAAEQESESLSHSQEMF